MNEDMLKREQRILYFFQRPKTIFIVVCSYIVVLIVFWFLLVWNENKIVELEMDKVKIENTSFYKFYIDDLSWRKDNILTTKDFCKIQGWLIKPGEEIESAAIKIVFQNMSDGRYYIIPTQMSERKDVTAYVDDGKNYDECGFSVEIPYFEKLNSNLDYEIFALYSLNGKENLIPFNITLKTWEKNV